jgi:hypothetical protein
MKQQNPTALRPRFELLATLPDRGTSSVMNCNTRYYCSHIASSTVSKLNQVYAYCIHVATRACQMNRKPSVT